jgi:hypothetical protein
MGTRPGSTALGIPEPYVTDIRAGRRVPHPRHWLVLAQLVELLVSEGHTDSRFWTTNEGSTPEVNEHSNAKKFSRKKIVYLVTV